jgi:single-strand DNA-binding protein
MASVNKVILVGNLGKDPEIKKFDSGIKNASFSLATTEKFKNKAGETVTTTEWHNIVVWGTLSEIAEKYLKKGSQIYLEGKIKTSSWEDKSGAKRYKTEIYADSFTMLGAKETQANETKKENATQPELSPNPDIDDTELPF